MTPHGSVSTYVHYGCRCVECRAAKAAQNREARARRLAASSIPAVVIHNANTYANWGCRCDVCTEAIRIKQRERYRRNHPESNRWTEDDLAILRAGYTVAQTARLLGRTENAISIKLSRMGHRTGSALMTAPNPPQPEGAAS